jgi:hypothetical protein
MFVNDAPKQKNGGSSSRTKRAKKGTWGARERASMSFILFVVFFGVFFIIILTEVSIRLSILKNPRENFLFF